MPKMTVLEKDLRKLLQDSDRFPVGVVTFAEWARGGDPGMPDSWIAYDGNWLPFELKRGEDPLSNFRPAQKAWAMTSLLVGCDVYCLSIMDDRSVKMYDIQDGGSFRKPELELHEISCWDEDDFNYNELTNALA